MENKEQDNMDEQPERKNKETNHEQRAQELGPGRIGLGGGGGRPRQAGGSRTAPREFHCPSGPDLTRKQLTFPKTAKLAKTLKRILP